MVKKRIKLKNKIEELKKEIMQIKKPLMNEDIGANTGLNPTRSKIQHDFILKVNENPDFNFPREIIPKVPNESYMKLFASAGIVAAGLGSKYLAETKGSEIVNRVYSIGGKAMVSSVFDIISGGATGAVNWGIKLFS